jgi:hypothetical protein
VRLFNIEADYQPLPLKRTLGRHLDLAGLSSLPDYVLLRGKGEASWFPYFIERDYRIVLGSPPNRGTPCLWYHPDALSYAFSIPIERLRQAEGPALDPALTSPITALERLPDRVALLVEADPTEALVVTVREVAFPGWRAEVDGEAAQLESVGGQVGVVLPPGSETHRVYFEYAPPLVYAGGVITLLACAFCVVYLLGLKGRGRA